MGKWDVIAQHQKDKPMSRNERHHLGAKTWHLRELAHGSGNTIPTGQHPDFHQASQSTRSTSRVKMASIPAIFLIVTVMSLENTPAVLSLGQMCEGVGYSYHGKTGEENIIWCQTDNHVPLWQSLKHAVCLTVWLRATGCLKFQVVSHQVPGHLKFLIGYNRLTL